MHVESWYLPHPAAEARSMLGLVPRLGVAAVRNLILISGKEETELREWAKSEPLLSDHIKAAIRFRKAVLRHFDKLIQQAAQEGKAA